jgi:hypothetical protein
MKSQDTLSTVAKQVCDFYRTDPHQAEVLIEDHLRSRLEAVPLHERLLFLEELCAHLDRQGSGQEGTPGKNGQQEALQELMRFVLGKSFNTEELQSHKAAEHLGAALQTLFETLNDLIQTIELTLMGQQSDQSKTIRTVIASKVRHEDGGQSLREHLNQIKAGFLIAHTSFQQSCRDTVKKILAALAPDTLRDEASKTLKFGPFRKAELFELFEERYESIRKWSDSDRFLQDVNREFEKSCRNQQKTRG